MPTDGPSDMDSILETLQALENIESTELNKLSEKSGYALFEESGGKEGSSEESIGFEDTVPIATPGTEYVRNASDFQSMANAHPFRFNLGAGIQVFDDKERKFAEEFNPGEVVSPKGKAEELGTVIEKTPEGKLNIKKPTGEEKIVDPAYVEPKKGVVRKPILAVEEEVEEKKEELEPEKEEKPKTEKTDTVYEEFVRDILTDPEIAPLVVNKLLNRAKFSPEVLSKLENLLPDVPESPSKDWWKTNGIKIAMLIWKGKKSSM
jgi:hypothetical protein